MPAYLAPPDFKSHQAKAKAKHLKQGTWEEVMHHSIPSSIPAKLVSPIMTCPHPHGAYVTDSGSRINYI